MKILDLPGGDELYHYKKSLVLKFSGPRDVVSTWNRTMADIAVI